MSGTKEHMPFPGHRTCAEWIAEEDRHAQTPWCPHEYRALFAQLKRKGFSGAEARKMVEEQIATDARRGSTYVPVGCEDSRKAYAAR